MPKIKLKNPPQGGEKWLCLTIFFTMLLAVVSTVGIIYAIVIIYLPSIAVLESGMTGDVMCTTLETQRSIDTIWTPELEAAGTPTCGNGTGWSSCEEWCLSTSNKECSHVYASTRKRGTEIHWEGCDLTEANYYNHTCNTLEDLKELNCKYFSTETFVDEFTVSIHKHLRDYYDSSKFSGNLTSGNAEQCIAFDNVQIQCISGICQNISEAYKCDFQDKLTDIKKEWKEKRGKGKHGDYCDCPGCTEEGSGVVYPDNCPDLTDKCKSTENLWRWNKGGYQNKTEYEICMTEPWKQPCVTCKEICKERRACYDMKGRRDPVKIGTDEFGLPKTGYYNCVKGYCVEIYNLTCERRCDSMEFKMKQKNSVIFSVENIIIADCSSRSTPTDSIRDSKIRDHNTLFVSCSNVTIDKETNSIVTRDCVNGTWLPDNFNGGTANYSYMSLEYGRLREDPDFRVEEISYEQDITIFNRTKLKINIEGCVNTLSEECKAFYEKYGRDGQNYTARAIYPCYYDPDEPDFVVINFDPDKTLMLLILFAAIPGGILTFSCFVCSVCSRFIHTGDDGHMRLKCCGKYVTGIGNVPMVEVPKRKKSMLLAD